MIRDQTLNEFDRAANEQSSNKTYHQLEHCRAGVEQARNSIDYRNYIIKQLIKEVRLLRKEAEPNSWTIAGTLTRKHEGWTDKELALIIRTNKLVIAYLESKGPEWELAVSPLMRELHTFKGFVDARGWK